MKIKDRWGNLSPIEDYVPDGNYIKYKDGSVVDILQIVPRDLENASPQDLYFYYLKFWKLHKTNGTDYKFLFLNFPYDTGEQQKYIQEKIEKTKNEQQKKWLRKALEELVWIEENKTKREFFLVGYFENEEEHREFVLRNLQIMAAGGEALLKDTDYETKMKVLFKIANQNMLIHKG